MKLNLKSFAKVSVKSSESFAAFDLSDESLEEISKSFPDIIDFDVNTDLLPVSFPLFVANHFNKNGEGVDSEAAVKIADSLAHKFTDVDHDRNHIVGHIVGTSFSEFNNDHKQLTREEALASTEPFNVICYAVLYEKVDKQFISEIKNSSDEESKAHKIWSASWEILYHGFKVAVGDGNFSDVEIIEGKEAYSKAKYLKTNKGSGYDNKGNMVRRIISGDIIGLGAGFTKKPAADVKGVSIADFEVEQDDEGEEFEDTSSDNENLSSQSNNVDVKNNRYKKYMEIEELIKKMEDLLAKVAPQESSASIQNFFAEEIRLKNQEWLKKQEDAKIAKEAAESAAKEQADLVKQTAEELQKAKDEIELLKGEKLQSLASQIFDSRMAKIDEAFELKDEARPFIAKEVSALNTEDESFASYLDKLKVMLPEKVAAEVQESIASEDIETRVQEEIAKRIPQLAKDTNLSETELKEMFSTASEVNTDIPNSTETKALTLSERFKKAIDKDSIKISY